jgi:hypothetical protein
MNGQCKLCLNEHVDLQESHFLPAAIYRILRNETAPNPNPRLITGRKAAIPTSWQMKAPLLCASCERRLNRQGENWVLRRCLQRDGRFPLAEILATRTPDIASPTRTTSTKLYWAANIPEIDIAALSYFAVSIFWRGSIHPWNPDRTVPVKLGPFREQFRKYLMGEDCFPKDCALWVAIREGKSVSRLTYIPEGGRKDGYHLYRFPMPGFAFSILVSRNIPARYRELCFVHGDRNPIIVTPLVEDFLEQVAVQRLAAAIFR